MAALVERIAKIIAPEAWQVSPEMYSLKTQRELETKTLVGPVRMVAREKARKILSAIREVQP